MSDTSTRTVRITTVVVGAGVAVVLAVSAAASLHGTAGSTGDVTSTAAAASAAPTATATATPSDTAPAPAPTPQPTTSVSLGSAAPIRTDLTARVTGMTSVKGIAAQPGEIGGPAVRFTVRLTNTTKKAIDLSNTVVNAAYGTDAEPAYALTKPGGAPFPASVAAGRSVTGSFVFTIPVSERGHVAVTVDTSTANPVAAFTGSAPR